MSQDELIVTLVKGHKRLTPRVPLRKFDKFVFVIRYRLPYAKTRLVL
ncbi:hypothetical protein ACTHPF_17475 [Paenibacillus sp. SAF-054]